MESVSELKFVIPPLAKPILRTVEGMGRNDYFLTAATLRERESVGTMYELFKELDSFDVPDVDGFFPLSQIPLYTAP